MDKLSERLWIMRVSLENLTDDELATLDEAAALARRVEEAPVGHLVNVMECSSIVNWEEQPPARLLDKRVRIVEE